MWKLSLFCEVFSAGSELGLTRILTRNWTKNFQFQPEIGQEQSQPATGKFLGWLGLFPVPGLV
jgi:hypothetical protein